MTGPIIPTDPTGFFAYGHVYGRFREMVEDVIGDLDPLPQEKDLTGTVVFRPVFQGSGAAGAVRVPDVPRSRVVVIREVVYQVKAGVLVDDENREGVWLAIEAGDQALYWDVGVSLRGSDGQQIFSRSYTLGPDVWEEAVDEWWVNLPDLIQSQPGTPTDTALKAAQLSAAYAAQYAEEAAAAAQVLVDNATVLTEALPALQGIEATAAEVAASRETITQAAVAVAITREALEEVYAESEAGAALPPRLSETELAARFASQADLEAKGGGTPPTPGFEALAAKVVFGGIGQHTVAVASDSTANDANDWVRLWAARMAGVFSAGTRSVYHGWNNTTSTWVDAVDKAGQWTPASDGVRLRDTFTTDRAEIVGSSPDVGPAWLGTVGGWLAEGGVAKITTTDANINRIASNVGTSEGTVKTRFRLNLTPGAASEQIRVYMGSIAAGYTGLWLGVGNTASGQPQFALYIATPSSRQVATVQVPDMTAYAGKGWVTIDLELIRAIQNVTLNITTPAGVTATTTATITEPESQYMAQPGYTHLVFVRNGAVLTNRIELDSVEFLGTPTPASGDLFEVWNGSIGGANTATFDAVKRATIWGGKHVDTLIIGFGHNNSAQTGEAFVAAVDDFVAAWMVEHPETKYVILTSQNPQFPPAANPTAHAARQYAARLLARRKGWDYIPVYEAFTAQPDKGKALTWPDGVHPSAAESAPYDRPGYGQPFWADVFMRCIMDRTS